MSTTMEVGKKLVELCRKGAHLEAIETLYAPNIVSLEAMANPEFPARLEGIAAVRRKGQWWADNHTVHKADAQGPWPHGDRFIVTFMFEVTSKTGPMAGQRMTLHEAALYTVKNSKIVQEEFFYDMG